MDNLVNFPVPLRDKPEVIAQVKVPWDLTPEEAEKICRLVRSLAKGSLTMTKRYPKDYYHPRFRTFMMASGAVAWALLFGYLFLLAMAWLTSKL